MLLLNEVGELPQWLCHGNDDNNNNRVRYKFLGQSQFQSVASKPVNALHSVRPVVTFAAMQHLWPLTGIILHCL